MAHFARVPRDALYTSTASPIVDLPQPIAPAPTGEKVDTMTWQQKQDFDILTVSDSAAGRFFDLHQSLRSHAASYAPLVTLLPLNFPNSFTPHLSSPLLSSTLRILGPHRR